MKAHLARYSSLQTNFGGGHVVSALAINSDDPSSNPALGNSFFCKISVWKEIE